MKLFKFKLLLVIFALPLMSCINEIVPPASEQEIISEISRTWTGDMNEDGFPYQEFTATITADTGNSSQILISNFHNSGKVVSATVSVDLMITIPEQTAGTQTFKGTGEISNDYSQISWDYTIETAEGTVQVTGTYTYGSPV
ncbi:MAG: hypothetical protein L3J35_00860 [Bacteroidales bacterium]|nr:hypothetical protein [Bacteroidales bacterium]